MAVKPILYSGPMVRALLDGAEPDEWRMARKWQTRRTRGLPQKADSIDPDDDFPPGTEWAVWRDGDRRPNIVCPHGQPGDLLWVRENWAQRRDLDGYNGTQLYEKGVRTAWYWADGPGKCCNTGCAGAAGRVRTARFMPRWASRLTLRLTDVRVERVQDISESDAEAEGCVKAFASNYPALATPNNWTCRADFAYLWDSINAKKCPWDSNPWVWVLCFETIQRNIDQVLKGAA